jgi:hypothetical protein
VARLPIWQGAVTLGRPPCSFRHRERQRIDLRTDRWYTATALATNSGSDATADDGGTVVRQRRAQRPACLQEEVAPLGLLSVSCPTFAGVAGPENERLLPKATSSVRWSAAARTSSAAAAATLTDETMPRCLACSITETSQVVVVFVHSQKPLATPRCYLRSALFAQQPPWRRDLRTLSVGHSDLPDATNATAETCNELRVDFLQVSS